jgi:tetratricopeptide (TPR) repeat protein
MKNYEIGEELYYKGKYSEAYKMFESVFELNDGDKINALNYMGCCLLNESNYTKAIEFFDRVSKEAPDWERPVFNKGRAYIYLQEYGKALDLLKLALLINPQQPDTYFYIGVYYEKTGDLKEALVWYKKSLKIDNGQPDVHLNLGKIYFKLNDIKKALLEFNKAILCDRQFSDAFFNKGLLLKTQGKLEKSLSCLEKAYRIDSTDCEVIKEIAEVYKELNNQEKAELWFEKYEQRDGSFTILDK